MDRNQGITAEFSTVTHGDARGPVFSQSRFRLVNQAFIKQTFL